MYAPPSPVSTSPMKNSVRQDATVMAVSEGANAMRVWATQNEQARKDM